MTNNRACPKCKATGHDSNSDHLFLMSSGDRWCCNRSEYHEDGEKYYEQDGVQPEDSSNGTTELLSLLQGKSLDDVPDAGSGTLEGSTSLESQGSSLEALRSSYRGILPVTYSKYKVLAEYDSRHNLLLLEHDLLDSDTGKKVTSKVRKLPKEFFTRSKTKGIKLQLFGQNVFPSAKRLLITEGELDCLSAYQMLSKWKVAVVSLPTGANDKAILDNMKYINQFIKGNKELILCLDNDTVGQELTKKLSSMFPSAKCMDMKHHKDANAYLTEGDEALFVDEFWNAERYKPSTIVRVSDVLADVLKVPEMGREWPWPTLTKLTYGRRDGEGMYLGAGVKLGKSEWVNQLIAHDCQRGWPIAALKYEEHPAMTIKKVAGKIDRTFYHKPGMQVDLKKLESTAMSLEPNLYLYPAFGSASWEDTKSFLIYAVASGCKTVIIDPLTKLTNHMDSSQTETALRALSDEIACLAHDMGFFYIITCHLKAPTSGPPHEMGGKVHSAQFRGSRAMMEATYYMMGIERNKSADLEEDERNTSTFVLLEDRAFGNVGKFNVFYDCNAQSYLEPTGGVF